MLNKKVGDQVKKGDSLVTIHSNSEDVQEVMDIVYDSYSTVAEKVEAPTLIYKEIH
jgi:pyrimidine-nucleoside phosphorylase